jgi:hypothetical protein
MCLVVLLRRKVKIPAQLPNIAQDFYVYWDVTVAF